MKFSKNFVPDDSEICNILGIPWNIITDTFLLSLCEAINDSHLDNVTKRIVLAVIACIFDPLGILAPYVITLKLLFQDVCALKCDWDAPLSDEFVKSWKKAVRLTLNAETISIPRNYFEGFVLGKGDKIDIHAFCDASAKAYAAAVWCAFKWLSCRKSSYKQN